METLKNSYQRFQEEGMIEVTRATESNAPGKLRLSPAWHCPRDEKTGSLKPGGRLWELIEKISLGRAEGEERPHHIVMKDTVLWQVDLTGKHLFEEALTTQKSTKLGEDETVEKPPKYRRKMPDQPKL